MVMKLSKWAEQQGITYKTAWRWFREGKLPVPAEQLPTGTILVKEPAASGGGVAVYARVGDPGEADELARQVTRAVEFANARGLAVSRIVQEIGSGVNGRRQQLAKLLADPEIQTIVVQRRDRLLRFGVEYLEAALAAQGRRLLVMEPEATAVEEWRQDMLEALTEYCAASHGPRLARRRAQRALEAAEAGAGQSAARARSRQPMG